MNNIDREEALRLAAVAVASQMNSPEDIRQGLEGITAESLHSPKLAEVVRKLYDVPPEALARIIRIEPRS